MNVSFKIEMWDCDRFRPEYYILPTYAQLIRHHDGKKSGSQTP